MFGKKGEKTKNTELQEQLKTGSYQMTKAESLILQTNGKQLLSSWLGTGISYLNVGLILV